MSVEQNQFAIDLCTEFKSAEIFTDCLKSDKESVIYNALTALTCMASIPKFKAALLIDVGDVLFPQLADLITVRLKSFSKCQLEIETQIVAFLAQITQSTAATKDPLTVAAKRRAHQQGFLEHYLERCATIEYKVEPEVDLLGENCQ